MKFSPILLVLLLCACAQPLRADDGASSIAAGGLVVMGKEPRISMAKEVLQISAEKVIVDYDFRNNSDQDITTEVAFPIPDYDLAMNEITPSKQGFDDFRLWIDGKAAHFQVEARAFIKGKDVTQLLNRAHVDIASFGHAESNDSSPQIGSLNASERSQLVNAGAIDAEGEGPLWIVRKKYHWTQTFPAHKVVHVRHEYTPVLGNTNSVRYGMEQPVDSNSAEELNSLCIDSRLYSNLKRIVETKGRNAYDFYVDFILTTANTWKTPIEDFTLIVQRPQEKNVRADFVSFCWDGPVRKLDADHFEAHAINFVPREELRVGFIGVEDRDD